MSNPPSRQKLPEIPAEAKELPWVTDLLRLLVDLQQKVEDLEEEIKRLKKTPGRPKLKASQIDQSDKAKGSGSDAESGTGKKRRGGTKHSKTPELNIDETRQIAAEEVPAGSIFKGYRSYIVQELIIQAHVIEFQLAQWQTPDGGYCRASLPPGYAGSHYGPTLQSFLLHQHHHNHVTQPLLREQLRDLGIKMSAGELNRLLSERHEVFHAEKAEIKAAGLATSSYLQTDDTGARHQGHNGYCTYLGNDQFAYYESTLSKSRINFLQLLQTERRYELNEAAFEYLEQHRLAGGHLELLRALGPVRFDEEAAWQSYLQGRGVLSEGAVRVATEGALVGGLIAQGFRADMAILSDDAPQFNLFTHGLCWVHTDRPFTNLVVVSDLERRALRWIQSQLWALYRELKDYKTQPHPTAKETIEAGFDALCQTETVCAPLNQRLQRLKENKAELLLVLERPELPLHNNLSESDLRERAKKRKISAGTRSELGRQCRDTFSSLKKTCRKQGLSFWNYLNDRIRGSGNVPRLADLIHQAVQGKAALPAVNE